MKSETRAYINIAAVAVVLLFNYLSNALPLNNLTQTDINEMYPVLFTPASYVFSIWGLIYVLLICFIVYQALPNYRENPFNEAVGILFAVTALLNVLWLLAWHYLQIALSMVIMVLLLLVLIAIYLRIANLAQKGGLFDRLFVKLTFSIYLAWICVATLANLNILLYDVGWLGLGFGSALFTVLMIVIGALVSLAIFYWRRDYAFPLVFAWAFIGVGVRHGADPVLLAIAGWTAAAAILFFMGWIIARTRGWPFLQK